VRLHNWIDLATGAVVGAAILAAAILVIAAVTPVRAAVFAGQDIGAIKDRPPCLTQTDVRDRALPGIRELAAPSTSPVTQSFLLGAFAGPAQFEFDYLEVWTGPDNIQTVFYLGGCVVVWLDLR
jgi:hypothetical protein